MKNSLEVTDAEAAAIAVAPRVSLASMEAKIKAEYFVTGSEAIGSMPAIAELDVLTICFLVMDNGFVIIGKAAPASPANFNVELGRKFAREDAIRQLWPMEGYALRARLLAQGTPT